MVMHKLLFLAFAAITSAYVHAAAPLQLARRSPIPAMLAQEEPKKVQTAEEPIQGAYQTDKPSDDPDETCFMTPSWMDDAGKKTQEWVCTKEPMRPDDSDDGF